MTSELESTKEVKQTSQTFGVPVAIVIAGGLIAAAVYFGGGNPGSSTNEVADTANTGDKVDAAAAPARPAEPAIGDIREVTSEDHIKGAENAKVTIIEYSDLERNHMRRLSRLWTRHWQPANED